MENTLKKIDLGLYPTPLQELSGMSELLGGGKRLFLKREDLCGIGLGGNKVRKLEYLLAEALAQGCDCVVTGGGSQSNQTIAAAACANRAGLETHLVVPASTGTVTRGIVELLGAVLHEVDSSNDLQKGIRAVSAELRKQGRSPYIIPPGASTTLGVLWTLCGSCTIRRRTCGSMWIMWCAAAAPGTPTQGSFWGQSCIVRLQRPQWCRLGGGSAIRVPCAKWCGKQRP